MTATATGRQALLGPVLILTAAVVSIISSLGAPLLVTVARQFHTSISTAQWSLTVTLIIGAVASPVLGRLGDGRRRRETIIVSLSLVTVGGVLTAVAPSFAVLLIGRALQGVGLGLVPLTMAAARSELPREKVAPMIALLSVTTGRRLARATRSAASSPRSGASKVPTGSGRLSARSLCSASLRLCHPPHRREGRDSWTGSAPCCLQWRWLLS
jgi:predicted MFS family arabinose efflux permease